jgi:hypothetical protein
MVDADDIARAGPPTKLDVFKLRCQAHARLVAAGEIGFHASVDALQDAAVKYGLVADIGQDAVQAIMAEAFSIVAEMIEEATRSSPSTDDNPDAPPVAPSKLNAVDYLVRENDMNRLRRFLDGRSDSELAAIEDHLRRQQRAAK